MTKTIRERRQALGISLRELSRQTGVAYGSCWAYEHRTEETESGFIYQKWKKVLDYLSKREEEEKERQEKNHVKPRSN